MLQMYMQKKIKLKKNAVPTRLNISSENQAENQAAENQAALKELYVL